MKKADRLTIFNKFGKLPAGKVAFHSNSPIIIQRMVEHFIELDMEIEYAYETRKYFFFGQKEYYCVMKPKDFSFDDKMARLLKEERYEEAAALRDRQLENEIKKLIE